MKRDIGIFPRVAIFLAGVAAGALSNLRSTRIPEDSQATGELKKSLAALDARVSAGEAATAEKFGQIEARLEEHSSKLAEMPSTAQIVGAMEQLLAKTMASLDERLTTQAHSIDVLRTTVGQTDSLLERVLESLDSLQSFTDPTELAEDPLLHRPVV
jgi:hypothetical protein